MWSFFSTAISTSTLPAFLNVKVTGKRSPSFSVWVGLKIMRWKLPGLNSTFCWGSTTTSSILIIFIMPSSFVWVWISTRSAIGVEAAISASSASPRLLNWKKPPITGAFGGASRLQGWSMWILPASYSWARLSGLSIKAIRAMAVVLIVLSISVFLMKFGFSDSKVRSA